MLVHDAEPLLTVALAGNIPHALDYACQRPQDTNKHCLKQWLRMGTMLLLTTVFLLIEM